MIGYYVHHHGRGHAHRAALIAAALDEPVVALGSALGDAFAERVDLPLDDQDPGSSDHDAGGALHWAPLHAPGYSRRMQLLAAWLGSARPRLVVVDVSVEVTALCRLLGVPVVVVAGAGDRPDDPHVLAYRLAARIIAPWPGGVYRPAHLAEHEAKTVYVGAMSRFDDLDIAPTRVNSVLVLAGAGGGDTSTADVDVARAATPDLTWTTLGLPGTPWSDDVWTALSTASVVVTHAGQNALAEVAAARRPAVVIAQDRPFDEQRATASALARHGLATVVDGWPTDWPAVLATARHTGGAGWSRWNDGRGAARAAQVLASYA